MVTWLKTSDFEVRLLCRNRQKKSITAKRDCGKVLINKESFDYGSVGNTAMVLILNGFAGFATPS
jgi:hypothetical protein